MSAHEDVNLNFLQGLLATLHPKEDPQHDCTWTQYNAHGLNKFFQSEGEMILVESGDESHNLWMCNIHTCVRAPIRGRPTSRSRCGGRGLPVEGRVVGRDGLLVDGAVVVVVMVEHRLVGLEVVEGGRVAVGVQREPDSLLFAVMGHFNALASLHMSINSNVI